MPILADLLVILGLAVGILWLCHHLRVPTVVGFLLTGVLAGPGALGLVSHAHVVEVLAEVGVVFLLFAIGAEFSIAGLIALRRPALLGGGLQLALTAAAGAGAALLAGEPAGPAVFLGLLLALSSTAVVLKVLKDRGEAEAPHGRLDLAVLLFQDLAIVPLMLLVPLLAGRAADPGQALLLLGAKAAGVAVLVVLGARWAVPFLLKRIAATRNDELFLLAIVALCFSIAFLTWSVGLSLPLGAFLAGLIVSESPYSHQALARVLPFKDVFSSLFFVSMGMLLDVGQVLPRLPLILPLTAGVLAVKALVAGGAVRVLGYPLRTAVLSGLALSQVGEFSFILAGQGLAEGLLAPRTYQLFLAVAVLGMAATPVLMAWSPRLAEALARRLPPGLVRGSRDLPPENGGLSGLDRHLLVVGYGLSGRNAVAAARHWDIPHVVLEMNPETVRRESAAGVPMVFGDASYAPILEHLGAARARVAVVAISDAAAARRAVRALRAMNPGLHLIVRCRYLAERADFLELGADEAVPEEFEVALEVCTRMLERYAVPHAELEPFVASLRAEGYAMRRPRPGVSACPADLRLPDVELARLRLEEGAPAHGRTLAELALRKVHGVTVLARRRGDQVVSNPPAETGLAAGDSVLVVGRPEQVAAVSALFRADSGATPP